MGKTLSIDKSYGSMTFAGLSPFYYSGSQVYGQIQLNLSKDFPSNVLHVSFKGYEKTTIVRTHRETSSDGSSHTHTTKTKGKHNIFEITIPITMNGAVFPAGQHLLPFVINLPQDLPTNFEQSYGGCGDSADAKVAYKFRVLLQSSDKKIAVYEKKHIKIVRSANTDFLKTFDNISLELNKRKFNFVVKLDKTFISNGMSINAHMRLDNSQSGDSVKKLKWKTVLKSTISTGSDCYSNRTRIDKKHLEGVSSRGIMDKHITITFKTPDIKGCSNPVSYNGKLIQNNYELEFIAVTPKMLVFSKDQVMSFTLKVVDITQLNPAPGNNLGPMPLYNTVPMSVNPPVIPYNPAYGNNYPPAPPFNPVPINDYQPMPPYNPYPNNYLPANNYNADPGSNTNMNMPYAPNPLMNEYLDEKGSNPSQQHIKK